MAEMDCESIRKNEVAERYIQGSLSEADRDAYERHFFACDACLKELQALQGMRQVLRRARSKSWSPPVWAWGLAACLLLAVGVRLALRDREPVASAPVAVQMPPAAAAAKQTALEELARFDPPAYAPVVLRGTKSEASRAFSSAMELYQHREYARAAAGLMKAEKDDPAAGFYLGICQLVMGRNDDGVASLRRTIGLGETEYRDPARFYLAKGLIRMGKVDEARAELTSLAGSSGATRNQAKGLLDKLAP